MKARAIATQHYVRTCAVATATETLKPISLHFSIAALAIVCAIAKEIFFSLTRLCAYAADDSATETAIPPTISSR